MNQISMKQPLKQPRSLRLLAVIQMLKFFSHYGVRALLVLFMVNELGYADAEAVGVAAVFCGLIEVFGILGGLVADRYLGLRRATLLGTTLLAVGYSGLLIDGALYLALGVVVLGGALFNSNITALLGSAYEEEDPRRQRGFTLFYMMQNLGCLTATVLCGVLATYCGFKVAFAFAALGMVVGAPLLLLCGGDLPNERPVAAGCRLPLAGLAALVLGAVLVALRYEQVTLQFLPLAGMALFAFFGIRLLRNPAIPRSKVLLLFAYLTALILFFAAEDQGCGTLILLAEQAATRSIFGIELSSSIVMAVNPMVILLFAAVVTGARTRLRFALPFALVAAGFGMICLEPMAQSVFGIMGAVFVISLAELMIGPVVFSFTSEIAAKGNPGVVMGMVPISFSLAFLLSGRLGKMVAGASSYAVGFAEIALIALVSGLVLELLTRRYSREPIAVIAT